MRLILVALAGLLITACENSIQTSSGREYLADSLGPTDADIAKAAAIGPDLRFPAKIGIARVVNGGLSLIPSAEVELFAGLAEKHANLGQFIPISPLIAEMVTSKPSNSLSDRYHNRSGEVVHDIRLAAARQHLDYVLIYEAGARSTTGNTPFALADVTLIGGVLLPTRSIKVAGVGQALLVDVRNGYPYGTAQTAVDLKGVSRTFNADRQSDVLQEKAVLKVVEALIPEVEDMFSKLAAVAKPRG